jgi:hypothetical protein
MLSSTAILAIPEFFRALSEKYPGSSYWQYNGLSACPPLAEIFLSDKYIAKTDKNSGMAQVALANLRMFQSFPAASSGILTAQSRILFAASREVLNLY